MKIFTDEQIENLKAEVFSQLDGTKLGLEDLGKEKGVSEDTYTFVMFLFNCVSNITEIFCNFLDGKEQL